MEDKAWLETIWWAALLAVIYVPRLRRVRIIPGVLIAVATLLALIIGLAALAAPGWVLALAGALGAVLVAAEIVVVYRHDHRRDVEMQGVTRRLDILDELSAERKASIMKRLWQVQSDVSVLTRDYHIAKSEADIRHQLGVEVEPKTKRDMAELEQEAVFQYRKLYEVEIMFVLQALRKSGIETDRDLEGTLQDGCSSVKDIDAISAGLHRMINANNEFGW